MNLYINASNRKNNCYKILKDLMGDEDKIISLSNKDIKYCLGCNACLNDLEKYCVQNDYMQEVYGEIEQTNDIIIAVPIYFDTINGLLKNTIDRFMPLYVKQTLKDKTVYLITIGEQTEEENENAKQRIGNYFEYLAQTFEFNFVFLNNLSSGENDNLTENYKNYEELILNMKEKIK